MIDGKAPLSPSNLVDRSLVAADQAIRSTQRIANEALDDIAGTAHDLRERAAPVVERVAGCASAVVHDGMDAVRERSSQLSDAAHRVADGTRSRVREEPVRSLLIAAAAGAVVMALLASMARTSPRKQ
jgi:ElaB/YqjD/DUF883 family membrane-anchored ribosome-binding protein